MIARLTVAACLMSLAGVSLAHAEEVKVKDMHLCCGACVKAVQKTLQGVEGISGVAVNKDAGSVTFQSRDQASAQKGVKALYDAGFYGESSVPGTEPKAPTEKKDQVSISHLHLCCGGCVKSAEAALKKVDGVTSVSAEQKQGKMTLSGNDISLAETLKALHQAGFHATVE